MLQNTVHRGLILQKVSITVAKNTTHMVLSLCTYFPLRIHCNERVSVFMHAIQQPATEKILVKGLQISEYMHVTMDDVINTIHVTRAVNHIPMVRNTILFKTLQLGSSKNICSVFFLKCALQ